MKSRPPLPAAGEQVLANREAVWTYAWTGGRLAATGFVNQLTGRAFSLAGAGAPALVQSGLHPLENAGVISRE
ncbi:MAG: hypothetical protein NT173_00060 [Opitutales bacterium]|nr:hypothetical protein [Opitutales bacterium]